MLEAVVPKTAARDLRTLYDAGVLGVLSDGQLLERFVADRDEAAFEILVRRHGTLVWGVCRRTLGSHHDAEDAFQATFLVLARKAASIVPRERLPNWLHGVARQTALKARAVASRRRRRETPMATVPEPAVVGPEQSQVDDRLEWLDRELEHLPDRYRAAIVLCELEGLTHQEAARRVGCPVGTLSARLSRGRALLSRRLARRGVAIPAVGLGAWLAADVASASVPATLAGPTARAAALFAGGRAVNTGLISLDAIHLARRVIRTMMIGKLKLVTVLVASVALVGAATSLPARPPAPAGRGADHAAPGAQQPSKTEPKPALAPEKQGPILTGRMVDEAGRPLPGVKIILYNGLATRWKGQEATTDRDGRYRFDPLQTGAMVKAEPSGRWDRRPGMSLEHPTHVSADGRSWWDITVPGIDRKEHVQDFKMVPGGRLAGRVLDPKTRVPLKRLSLNIGSPSKSNSRFHVYARTDDEGRFISEPLFPGEYVVYVNVTELGMPELSKVRIEANKTLEKEFSQDKLKWAIAMGVTARNGKNRLENLKAFTMTTRETDGNGQKSTAKHFVLLPDRYRSEIRKDGDDKTLIYIEANSIKEWYKQDDGRIRATQSAGPRRPPGFSGFIEFFGPRAVLLLEDPWYRLKLLDDGKVGDKAVFGIGVTMNSPDAKELQMFFDMDTGLLLKDVNTWEGSETVFEEFKEIHVIPMPLRSVKTFRRSKSIVKSELIEFKAEETLPARLFQEP